MTARPQQLAGRLLSSSWTYAMRSEIASADGGKLNIPPTAPRRPTPDCSRKPPPLESNRVKFSCLPPFGVVGTAIPTTPIPLGRVAKSPSVAEVPHQCDRPWRTQFQQALTRVQAVHRRPRRCPRLGGVAMAFVDTGAQVRSPRPQRHQRFRQREDPGGARLRNASAPPPSLPR